MKLLMELTKRAFRAIHNMPTDEMELSLLGLNDAAMQSARRHRTMILLEAGLQICNHLPSKDSAVWKTKVYGQAQNTTRKIQEATRLYDFLSRKIEPLILVKGPALAVQAWPDAHLRNCDDLDFVCGRRDYASLLKLMKECGYHPTEEDYRRRENLWHYGWGISFQHTNGDLVEFNHRFFPGFYPWPSTLHLDSHDLLCSLSLDGSTIRSLKPSAHLILAAMHSAWHGWERLGWVVDIGGLLVLNRGILAEADRMVACCGFAQNVLRTGCLLAEDLFGPGVLIESLPSVPMADVSAARHMLEKNAVFYPGQKELAAYHRQILCPISRFNYSLKRAFIPGDGDFQAIHLGQSFRWLYPAIRPFRFVFGFIVRKIHR